MNSRIRVLVIEPGTRKAFVREVDAELETFQSLVGGSIEGLTLSPEFSVYINEDGKYLRLDRNVWGEAFILNALKASGQTLLRGDFIVGPVVVVGAPDHGGWDRSVPESAIELAREVGVEVVE